MIEIPSGDLLHRAIRVFNDVEEDLRDSGHLLESGDFLLETTLLREHFEEVCTSKSGFSTTEAKEILGELREACLTMIGKMEVYGI